MCAIRLTSVLTTNFALVNQLKRKVIQLQGNLVRCLRVQQSAKEAADAALIRGLSFGTISWRILKSDLTETNRCFSMIASFSKHTYFAFSLLALCFYSTVVLHSDIITGKRNLQALNSWPQSPYHQSNPLRFIPPYCNRCRKWYTCD